MNIRVIPRTAVNSWLKLVRLPLDGAIRLLPGSGSGPRPTAKLAIDRADATVRAVIAGVLGDSQLSEKEKELTARDEANRLREAAGNTKAERKNGASGAPDTPSGPGAPSGPDAPSGPGTPSGSGA